MSRTHPRGPFAAWKATRDRRRRRRTLVILWAVAALGRASGYALSRITGPSPFLGMYAELERLGAAGLIGREWETPEPTRRGRRRLYVITDAGRRHADVLVTQLSRPEGR